MTGQDADRIVALASLCFSGRVDARPVRDSAGAAVYLFNRALDRYITLHDAQDWPSLRDCWLTALGMDDQVEAADLPRERSNLWAFWH